MSDREVSASRSWNSVDLKSNMERFVRPTAHVEIAQMGGSDSRAWSGVRLSSRKPGDLALAQIVNSEIGQADGLPYQMRARALLNLPSKRHSVCSVKRASVLLPESNEIRSEDQRELGRRLASQFACGDLRGHLKRMRRQHAWGH